jgi:hypothetical protein
MYADIISQNLSLEELARLAQIPEPITSNQLSEQVKEDNGEQRSISPINVLIFIDSNLQTFWNQL